MNNYNYNNNELAKIRTKLANQRTYLAYMRTGFTIATIAGIFKKMWIILFGIIMIIGSFSPALISEPVKAITS